MDEMTIDVEFPPKLECLFEPKRYKILYGGRGAGRSWSCARRLLIMGVENPIRILCAREFQTSIKESVYQLLSDQISLMELDSFYNVKSSEILGSNGTAFFFEGIRHNTQKIKSYEGVDVCWIEEAQAVSKTSWDILIPTIRKKGSEIWLTFNPALEEDETYQRFVVSPPEESFVIKMTWRDNPWFPEELEKERIAMKKRDPAGYDNVWEGNCRATVEGAIFAKEMREAMEEGRICELKYDARKPVTTVWDLGYANFMSIWFVQFDHPWINIIDYVQGQFKKVPEYVNILNEKKYSYDRHFLPHDSEHHHAEAERTTKQIVMDSFPNCAVHVLKNFAGSVEMGIEAARNIFPHCKFDVNRCADGLQALRHHKYSFNTESGRWSKTPEHISPWCDGAAAFQHLALSVLPAKPPRMRLKKKTSIYTGEAVMV